MNGTPGASMPPAAGPGNADSYIIGKNTRPANPTPLSAPQEQQVRDLYYKNVRAKCADEIEGTSKCCVWIWCLGMSHGIAIRNAAVLCEQINTLEHRITESTTLTRHQHSLPAPSAAP
jgi:hypothetical protein